MSGNEELDQSMKIKSDSIQNNNTSNVNYKSKYYMLILLTGLLGGSLVIGTKNKINMNFSKNSNKAVLLFICIYICYIYSDNISKYYFDIKNDIMNPGNNGPKIVAKVTGVKKEISDISEKGYIKENIDKFYFKINDLEKTINYSYEISDILKEQLKNDGAIGYVVLVDNAYYSIKNIGNNNYILEGKINRNDMTRNSININIDNPKYKKFYNNIKYKELFDNSLDMMKIILDPSTSLNIKTLDEINNEYYTIINDDFKTENEKNNAKSKMKEEICSKCKSTKVSNNESKRFFFTDETNHNTGDLPKCVKIDTGLTNSDGTKIYENNCCVIEENDTRYSCPNMCFDWSDEQKQKEPLVFKANEYTDILKSNSFCSNIEYSTNMLM